jgi:SAM-dependent methyltransferase
MTGRMTGTTTTAAAYDGIADWYEHDFLGRDPVPGHPLSHGPLLRALLGEGEGTCLEIGCGTGVHAAALRSLGWAPLGVDLSAGMLRYARGRLPVLHADATRLPLADGSVDAAVAVMVHTDMPVYPAVLREAARVLRPGGRFVHIGLHPCFFGAFADRTDPEAVVLRPGYLARHRTARTADGDGVRARAGAFHRPLPDLLNALADAGLAVARLAEAGEPIPVVLAAAAVKGRPPA